MMQAASSRVRSSGRVTALVLPLALLTWAGATRAAGVEIGRPASRSTALDVAPAAVPESGRGPGAGFAPVPATNADACRNPVGGRCLEGRADRGAPASPPVRAEGLARGGPASGHSLASHRVETPAPLGFEAGEMRVRAASSGWEWGAGSAAIAAWLLGLRQRWRRPKA